MKVIRKASEVFPITARSLGYERMSASRRIWVTLVYSLGIFVFYLLTYLLFRPAFLAPESIPLHMAAALLLLNAISAIWATQHQDLEEQLAHERSRLGIVQGYGSYIIFAAAVVSAITGVRGTAGVLFFSYLACSLVASIGALVPIWMPEGAWWSYSIVRHMKTVAFTYSIGWLAQAVTILVFTLKT